MNITISASTVAWYAAIVATLSVAISAYRVVRDRVRVRVSAKANQCLSDRDGTFIVIEAANVGRRVVHLAAFPYFPIKGEKTAAFVVKGPWEPKATLNEGESAVMLCNQTDKLSRMNGIVVKDQTGRKWKGRLEPGRAKVNAEDNN